MNKKRLAEQTMLEQVARELWDLLEGARPYVGPTKDLPVKAIVEALAAQRVTVLEEAATKVESFAGSLTSEQCDGCGNYDDVAEGSRNDAYRYAAAQLRQHAQEQRP